MKKVSVIVLVVVGLMFAAYAEAAKPKRHTRNAKRIGPYAGALIGMSRYTDNQIQAETDLENTFNNVPTQNLVVGTDNTDMGYAAQFGYRFNRFIAAEFALAQYGELNSHARAQIDTGNGSGFIPAAIDLKFHIGGPKLSLIGILPFNEKFEFYGQVGVLFAASEREFVIKIDGDPNSFGSVKADSTELVLGAGAAFHVNQMYTVRLQYEKLSDVGDKQRNGTENVNTASIGLIVRF
jgi:opacity protein-like surface antigen